MSDAEPLAHPDGARSGDDVPRIRRHEVRDAREMRALAHPVRIRLLELLRREGTLTATEAADLLDETPANCSFHLRTLAKYGYVEEAEGGTGRQRPWRRSSMGLSFATAHDDPETTAAAEELSGYFRDQRHREEETWEATWHTYPQEWQDGAFNFQGTVFLTAEELAGLNRDFMRLVDRYADRLAGPEHRPEGARPVAVTANGFPLPLSKRGH